MIVLVIMFEHCIVTLVAMTISKMYAFNLQMKA